ncbi:hypothetical protein HMI56_005346 [Coelomomyces lativittatus]|nr:hypothetical protein HMI56_005346 [Coelomomyces lativittatus]
MEEDFHSATHQHTYTSFAPLSIPKGITLATTMFRELEKELHRNPKIVGNLKGLFCIKVIRKGNPKGEWHVYFYGQNAVPEIIPIHDRNWDANLKKDPSLPVVYIEIDQRDLFNFFSGGLNSYKAITSGKVRVSGDLNVAMLLESVFRKVRIQT